MHIRRVPLPARERGDTIVEVLIAVAIASLILGGAYVVSNTSLNATRAAQERGIALKLGQSQMEQLKSVVQNSVTSPQVFGSGAPAVFCITGGTTVVDFTTNLSQCQVDSSGTPVPASVQPQFTLKVTHTGSQFTLLETWPDVSGKQTDHLQLDYRVYQQ
ncbi:MAG TPA: hypothetical protein VLH84_03090 [Patescibacteria group bacterium]|nr:hypothetical protein [Patescibacteria group bacterium]